MLQFVVRTQSNYWASVWRKRVELQYFKVSIRLFTKQGEDKFTDSKRNYLSLAWHHGEAKLAVNLQLKRTVQYRRPAAWRGFSGILRLYLYSVALYYVKSKLVSIFWVEMCVHLYMELVSWLQVLEVEWCLHATTVTGYVRNVHSRHRLCYEQQTKTGVSRTLQLLCNHILLKIGILISSVFTIWYFFGATVPIGPGLPHSRGF